MRRLALLLVLAGCSNTAAPTGMTGSFFLSRVDDKPLPTGSKTLPAGFTIEVGALSFGTGGRPRAESPPGVVTYTLHVRRDDRTLQISRELYSYTVSSGLLHINLCPRYALCAAVLTELVGPIDDHELVLTQKIGGTDLSTYRFILILPD